MSDSGQPRNDQASPTLDPGKAATTSGAPPASPAPQPGSVTTEAAPRSNWFRRVLWMDQCVTEARKQTFGPSCPGWAEYEMARQSRDGVVQIGETGSSSLAVLLLERAAASLLIRAHMARQGAGVKTRVFSESDWESARSAPLVREALNNLSVTQMTALAASLTAEGDHAVTLLADQDRKSFAIGLHNLVAKLIEPLEFEASRLGRALFARWTRVTIAGVVALAVVGFLVNWIASFMAKPNIALHSGVEVSSQYPGEGMDHTLLVDGDHSNLGFHTNCEGEQFVIIDLGAIRKFDKVVVYNRADGFQERAVPLKLEVSRDHQNFQLRAVKKEVFDKWTVSGLKAEARYLRLKNTAPNCFHLAEVEVY
jgi:hypothetical protein